MSCGLLFCWRLRPPRNMTSSVYGREQQWGRCTGRTYTKWMDLIVVLQLTWPAIFISDLLWGCRCHWRASVGSISASWDVQVLYYRHMKMLQTYNTPDSASIAGDLHLGKAHHVRHRAAPPRFLSGWMIIAVTWPLGHAFDKRHPWMLQHNRKARGISDTLQLH